MLPGIQVKQLKRFPDERGSFTEIFRNDWSDFIVNEFKKVIPELIIDDSERLRIKNQKLEDEKSEFELR